MRRSHQRSSAQRPTSGRNLAVVVLVLAIAGVLAFNVLRGTIRFSGETGTAVSADPVETGRRIYLEYCAACHGANLQGQPGWQDERPGGVRLAPALDASGTLWRNTDQRLFEITKYGGQRFAAPDELSAMPGYETQLSDTEIEAVLAYIKSAWPADIREQQEQLSQ